MLIYYSTFFVCLEFQSHKKVHDAFDCLPCSGFGDICPGEPDLEGQIFLTILPLLGLGFFCGPILSMGSSWSGQVPGGLLSLAFLTLSLGISALTTFEGLSVYEAIHLSVITGAYKFCSKVSFFEVVLL